ncbi:MAG TPA: flagellar export chaperone FliS [Opitutaceae bacterium]|jgi:flagellar protein FliS
MAPNYARLYRDNSILTANPGQLVLMMFDGALGAMSAARVAFDRPATDLSRIEVIHKQIMKAQRILTHLDGTLNFEVGGDFAPLMRRLYQYYIRRLHDANRTKQADPIVEVEGLLRSIRDAWAEMLLKQGSGETVQADAQLEAAGALS